MYALSLVAAFSFFLSSCSLKDYPKNKPYVYETNIHIEGKYKTDEKKLLQTQMEQQLHDSIRVRRERKFLFWNVLKNPAVYDTTNVAQSILFMRGMLHRLGYYRDSLHYSARIDTLGDQQRTTLDFTVMPGKIFTMDSIWYNLLDSVPYRPEIDTLQQLTIASLPDGLLKKGAPFSTPDISAELDRLSDVYRNNGYLRFSKEQLWAVWDTVGIKLIMPAFTPQEQLEQIEELRRRRENPIADVEIRLRPDPDTERIRRYYIGNVKVYPDFNSDTALYDPKYEIISSGQYPADQYGFVSYGNLFKNRKLVRFLYLHRGELYRQSNYLRTQNKLNSLGSWRLVTINQIPRSGTDTVDFELKLIPADKYNTSVTVDVSRNQGNIASEGNLLGLGATFSLLNRNFAKAANQSTLNLRYGIELTSRVDSIQTQQVTASYTIQFPRIVPLMRWIPRESREDAKTFLSFNMGYTDRINYYTVTTLNTSWGYEFTWKKTLFGIRIPNIEYSIIRKGDQLRKLEDSNKSYKYIFNDGLIISTLLNWTIASGNKKQTNLTRVSLEESGFVTGPLIHSFMPDAKLYRFAKLDVEYTTTRKIRRTAIAFRAFGGIGYGLPFSNGNGTIDSNNYFMPFFRQYYAGGPNSMRAWSVRKLGPGSSIKGFGPTENPDRFGDIRFETNLEYRYYIAQLFGYPLEGALFADVGNVWFLRENKDFPNGTFNLKRLGRDLAVGMGTGLRIDFGFLKARFDFAWKVKDPSPGIVDASFQNKWFYKLRPWFGDKRDDNGNLLKRGAQIQIGINYPF